MAYKTRVRKEYMKEIKVEQGTGKWLEYRRGRVTAKGYCSNPFCKSYTNLVKEKINPKPFFQNNAMKLGIEMEPILLAEANAILGTKCKPLVALHDDIELMSSLDGYDRRKKIVLEIKTTSKAVNEYGELLKYYAMQVYTQMYVTDAKQGYMYVANMVSGEKIMYSILITDKISIVPANPFYDEYQVHKPNLPELVSEFMTHVENYKSADNEKGDMLLAQRASLTEQLKAIKQAIDDTDEKLIALYPTGYSNSTASLSVGTRTTIDYETACQEVPLDIVEQFLIKTPDWKAIAEAVQMDVTEFTTNTKSSRFSVKKS